MIDQVLAANERYASSFSSAGLPARPNRNLAVLACMDARQAVHPMLGLRPGDAHVIRNAGGIVTEDVVRSLVISHYLLGTREFMIINHTDCGMVTFKDEELRERLERETGVAAIAPSVFHAFQDVEDNVRKQIARLRAHPWVPRSIPIRGFVYDINSGRLGEVSGTKSPQALSGAIECKHL
ncbi:MAG TPA: carbonic anhydrase [Bryobacteraceae bacterium]|nr:carbonic anhydrase [Bryobacteraceae bacterium]